MKRVNAVYALLHDKVSNKVLMVNNKDNDSWTLPGGAVEESETLAQAVVREVFEETGLKVIVKDIVSINEKFFKEEEIHAIFFTFNAKITGGDISIQYPDEIGKVEWVDIKEASILMPYHKDGIEKLLHNSATYYFQE